LTKFEDLKHKFFSGKLNLINEIEKVPDSSDESEIHTEFSSYNEFEDIVNPTREETKNDRSVN